MREADKKPRPPDHYKFVRTVLFPLGKIGKDFPCFCRGNPDRTKNGQMMFNAALLRGGAHIGTRRIKAGFIIGKIDLRQGDDTGCREKKGTGAE